MITTTVEYRCKKEILDIILIIVDAQFQATKVIITEPITRLHNKISKLVKLPNANYWNHVYPNDGVLVLITL